MKFFNDGSNTTNDSYTVRQGHERTKELLGEVKASNLKKSIYELLPDTDKSNIEFVYVNQDDGKIVNKVIPYTEGISNCSGLILLNLDTNSALLAHIHKGSYAIDKLAERFSKEPGEKVGIYVRGDLSLGQMPSNFLEDLGISMLEPLDIETKNYHLSIAYNPRNRDIIICSNLNSNIITYKNVFPPIDKERLKRAIPLIPLSVQVKRENDLEARKMEFIARLKPAVRDLDLASFETLLNSNEAKRLNDENALTNLASMEISLNDYDEERFVISLLKYHAELLEETNNPAPAFEKLFHLLTLFANSNFCTTSDEDLRACIIAYNQLADKIKVNNQSSASNEVLLNCMRQIVNLSTRLTPSYLWHPIFIDQYRNILEKSIVIAEENNFTNKL